MEPIQEPITPADMSELREGIKRRYSYYHALNRDKYPAFDFNTNRANYQPLKSSFAEEFFEKRQIDPENNHLHIPSLNTFAQLFSNTDYVPSRKIVNTCRLYAQATIPQLTADEAVPTIAIENDQKRSRFVKLGIGIGIVGLLCLLLVYWALKPPSPASGLIILSPVAGQTVPRFTFLDGRVSNADTVWVVVHPAKNTEAYYVMDPVTVRSDGTWRALAYVGTADHRTDGLPFEIRAFVRPGGSYNALHAEEKYVYPSWPETAQLATEPIIVVRGPKQR